jgi:hypothetical protein
VPEELANLGLDKVAVGMREVLDKV